ncbi:MAG: hypothetical protein OXT06_26865 [Rhodospirillaceae bacterium]|nr:hypothetical protein [Rhodospirillaceae bacterium]MDD9929486.1 hypothetical protein [Rhodospirillaceae bacterium]
MFQIFHDGQHIGNSALETGDPPMGAAGGEFIPSNAFETFRANVEPEPDNNDNIKRWAGLALATSEGEPIECIGVALFEYDFGDHMELEVDAVGIGYPLYEELFPGRHAKYIASFVRKAKN